MNKNLTAKLLKIFIVFALILAISIHIATPTANEAGHNIAVSHEMLNRESTQGYYYLSQNAVLRLTHSRNTGNITLPATYYVRATGEPDMTVEGVTYRKVVYNGIEGMVDINYLSNTSLPSVNNPYFAPKEELSASSADNNTELWLYYSVPNQVLQAEKLSVNTKLRYLAKSADNTDYIYVQTLGQDNRYGYVDSNMYTPMIVFRPNTNAINPDLPTGEGSTSSDGEVVKDETGGTVRIVLIVILCLLAVFVIFLLFKPAPKKKSSHNDFYEV